MTPQKSNIPALRFPEFKGEWKEMRLDEVATFYNGRAYKQEELLDAGKYRVLRVGNFFTSNSWYYSDIELDDTKYCIDGDLLYAWSASFGPRIWRGEKVIYHYHIWKVVPKEIVEKDFLFTVLNYETEKIKTQSSNGLGLLHITKGTIESWNSGFPNRDEQKRIADFLTAVDQKIAQLTEKKSCLEQYKKGVIQRLFTQRLRFQDTNGNPFPDWEEKRLEQILSYTVDNRGKTPPLSDSGIPLIEINAIGNKNIDFSKVNKFVSEEVYQEWFRNYLRKGDVLFSTVGATAICSFYDGEIISAVAQNIVGLRFEGQNNHFMYYLLTERQNNKKFKQIEMQAVQPSIKVSQMVHLSFQLPVLEEQQKIADFLTAIDAKITSLGNQLTAAQDFKKSLLQKMFV